MHNTVVAYKSKKQKEHDNPFKMHRYGSQYNVNDKYAQLHSARVIGEKRDFKRILDYLRQQNKHEHVEEKKVEKPHRENNLKLEDYLKLASLSRKFSRSKEHMSKVGRYSSPHTSPSRNNYHNVYQSQKKGGPLDNKSSISLIHKQTQQQLHEVEHQFKKLLRQIDHCSQISDDEESLIFMCNVFHVFEEKVCQTVKLAQALIEVKKRQKKIKELKKYGKEKIDVSKIRPIDKANGPSSFFNSSAFIRK